MAHADSLLMGVHTCTDFGANVKTARLAQGLSVAEVAKCAHLSASTVRAVEAGKVNPCLNTMLGIARSLGKCRETFGID